MSEINHEAIIIQIREGLQRNNIKLWLEPYCVLGESNEVELTNLAKLLAQQLNIKYEYCFIAISELQNTALDNLKSIDEFNETGVATLKIRIPSKSNGTKLLSFKIKLTDNASDLQEMISAKLESPPANIKIIANGKVLELDKPLGDQGVKNNKQIMALVTENVGGTVEDPYARIRKIRSEADVLLKNKDSGFLAIEDQSGKSIHLPEAERRSIIMALLLYEKGRVQLKIDNFSDALILFLEADEELKNCNSKLVQSVDNVALLNLDIVWCYLNLKSIMQLPDAENRLWIVEENFKRSYGENLSRVQSVKGSSENEKCLIARLHLMKGILCFHQNNRDQARLWMDTAQQEIAIAQLKVDDRSVELLIEMGYSQGEAITGLRSSYNSIDGAVNFILERRQKFAESRKEGKSERQVQKFLNNLGLTANPRSVLTLSEMGYPRELCALALMKTKEDISQAQDLLQNQYQWLKDELLNVIKPDEKKLNELTTLGFDASIVERILKLNVNNFQKSLDALLEMQRNNTLPQPQQLIDMMGALSDGGASTSSGVIPGAPTPESVAAAAKKAVDALTDSLAEEAAYDGLRNDLDHLDQDDEYLTLTLEKEQAFLTQYSNALRN